MNYEGRFNGPETKLVATKLPPGKKLYETPGQTEDKERLLKFARTCGNCPDEIEAVTAESVGLEWHVNGAKQAGYDEYRKGRWVILQNAEVSHGDSEKRS